MSYVEYCNKHGEYKGDYCGDCIDALYEENAALKEALTFTLNAAEQLYKPDLPLMPDMAPMFYYTLSYEGDLELIARTKKARSVLDRR